MDVELLYIEGCPHWQTAETRLQEAAAAAGLTVVVRRRSLQEGDDLAGFSGSPTILVDGRDLFPYTHAAEGLSCRIYSTPEGPAGSPTVDQLSEVLTFASRCRAYTTVVARDERRRVLVPVPFDPDEAWGRKRQHRVHGSINGMDVRAVVEPLGDGLGIFLGPAWRRPCGIAPGDKVDVVLGPEGPQRDDLAPDVAAALDAEPDAGEFFDSLAQFYRRAYLRWIDGTKRRPDVRVERITEMVDLLKAGHKERPNP